MAEPDRTPGHDTVSFGPFILYVQERMIEREGKPVKLGGRALDILVALIERAGETVSHKDLVARAWPTVYVDDTNLRVNVASLRKALIGARPDSGTIRQSSNAAVHA